MALSDDESSDFDRHSGQRPGVFGMDPRADSTLRRRASGEDGLLVVPPGVSPTATDDSISGMHDDVAFHLGTGTPRARYA